MKNLKFLLISLVCVFFVCACSINITPNTLENAEIYTTVYPVEYIVNYLYGENSTVKSIYPDDVDLDTYKLTEKQEDTYANSDLFVYIGLSDEKKIAKKLLNKNDNLLIIDSTYGLSYNNGLEEMWLAPNNFLMLVKNIRSSLNEYITNTFTLEDIDKKYDELYQTVTWIDAELREIADDAKKDQNNTIVVSSNVFKYLENYGFNVISLEEIEASKSETAINDIKTKFKKATYSKILTLEGTADSDLVNELVTDFKATKVEINSLIKNKDSSSDYVSIQDENLTQIREYF